jgi:membrane fusion protein (multidrug efflux system)
MKKYIVASFVALLLLAACGRKQEAGKNMEQLQKEQGIPVRIQAVENQTFKQELSYNAVLNGLEESTAQAMVSDIVTSINARVGDHVTKGQVIVTFPQNTPAAQYEQATTAFNAQKQAYERMQRLFEQGAISRQDLDNMETGYKVARANLDASEQMIKVQAPISGIITNVWVNPSEKVFPGKELFTVSSPSGFKAVVMVPESEVARIRNGTPATAEVGETTIRGRVSQIALAVDQNSKAVRVEVVFPGANRQIKFGTTARINLDVLNKNNVIVVDREHLVRENGKSYVWLAVDNHAKKAEIETGLDNKLQFEVVSGLAAGDKLITQGLNMLTDDALIRVIE